MTSQSDGGLADFFVTLSSPTEASGHTYSGVPTNGCLGHVESRIAAYAAMMPSYPNMMQIANEGGQNFYAATSENCLQQ
jgi:hypothetical protein